jgi:GNAT superfamily N-acetyltransferase
MTGPSTRRAVRGDGAALAGLATQLGYPSSADALDARLDRVLEREDHAVFVAETDAGEIIGWIHVFLALRMESPLFAELGGLVVAAAHRRRGAGRVLVERAADWACRQGVRTLRVRSRTAREEARVFYERLGFTETKRQRVLDRRLIDDA